MGWDCGGMAVDGLGPRRSIYNYSGATPPQEIRVSGSQPTASPASDKQAKRLEQQVKRQVTVQVESIECDRTRVHHAVSMCTRGTPKVRLGQDNDPPNLARCSQ